MKKILILCAIIISLSNIKCVAQSDFQNGYIITSLNDTIYGLVDYRSDTQNYQSCRFKNSKDTIEYRPKQLNGFGYLNGKSFKSEIIPDFFVEVLVSGEICLYKSESDFIVRKNEGEIYVLKTKVVEVNTDWKKEFKEEDSWRNVLAILTYNCFPNSKNIVKKIKLTEKDLTKLIKDYNKCTKPVSKYIPNNKPWSKVEFGISIGMTRSSLNTSNTSGNFPYLSNSYNSTDPTLGLLADFSCPYISENIALQTELQLDNSTHSSFIKKTNGSFTSTYDTQIKLTSLSLPISIKYTLPIKKYSFFVQGGVLLECNLEADTKMREEAEYKNIVTSYPEKSAFNINRVLTGLYTGAGITRSFSKFNISAAVKYSNLSKLDKSDYLTVNYNRIGLSIIVFKK